ncbi:alpha/beta hydrolase [Steroidobacter agaridevorans]|uniref:alpha/beta hydrolase n=1 Tax=Steroidobacter agaridevorans TaxID=2695856 RepID=UPI00132B26C8|nr:alpha/beta hydrolase [Steroidobacter agaridevorans]GFE90670.1 hydrolase [Steroidobacter agaridevorans]
MAVEIKQVRIGWRSRWRVKLLRSFFKPLVSRMAKSSPERIVALQTRAVAGLKNKYSGLTARYGILGNVPGPIIGEPGNRDRIAILYLHGGAFVFPASPNLQVELLGRMCSDLEAFGFMPDYRLIPQHPWPAALNDCEHAYRALLNLGFAPERIVVIGESAGGNLVLCLLQRIRKAGLPMPACAVPISAVTELGRTHAPPSRGFNAKREALIPTGFAYRMTQWYVNGQDASNPEISPLYADYSGFPPLYFLVGEEEFLLDDTLLAAARAREAGVETQLDVWPVLPHAFPLFEAMFREAPLARKDMVAFIQRHVGRRSESSNVTPLRA